ncbi:unnamed protein product [Linum tenue]|uniref:Uncharacterized protein n=1 Tax=Linum tenue TaxID=586396 RepID=A0AAV0RQU5_9ROSI|nr:unnamed protein product [Linum tenue]CAI0560107.1 unnamed protein product [Linum tenue]
MIPIPLITAAGGGDRLCRSNPIVDTMHNCLLCRAT